MSVRCEHIETVPYPEPAARTQGCEECEALGMTWVHLRKCMVCGHVGCCDSSIGKHSTRHFRETGHAVMRTHEPDEDWAWCFIHDTYL